MVLTNLESRSNLFNIMIAMVGHLNIGFFKIKSEYLICQVKYKEEKGVLEVSGGWSFLIRLRVFFSKVNPRRGRFCQNCFGRVIQVCVIYRMTGNCFGLTRRWIFISGLRRSLCAHIDWIIHSLHVNNSCWQRVYYLV